jgi:DNA-binding PadR family transcriptional regulator
MTIREAVSATDVIILFEKNYDVRLSPGTLYPILYRLERRGYIKELPKRRKKFYVLTDSGRKVLEDIEQRLKEIQIFITCLLNKRVSRHDYQI